MLTSIIMLFAWQMEGDKYKYAFDKSSEAYYQGSQTKLYVDKASDNLKTNYPIIAAAAPLAYTVGVRKEISLKTNKKFLIPCASASYQYSYAAKSGSIGISWNF